MSSREHWDEVYLQRAPEALSWYQPHHERSCAMIELCHMEPDAHITPGGASQDFTYVLCRRLAGEP